MHENAPECTRMHQNAPECTRMDQNGSGCARMHQNARECCIFFPGVRHLLCLLHYVKSFRCISLRFVALALAGLKRSNGHPDDISKENKYLLFLVLFEGFHGSGARCPTALIWDAGGEHVESAESSFLVGYEVYFSCGGIGAQAEILILAEHATESYSPSTQRRSRPLVPRKRSAPAKN